MVTPLPKVFAGSLDMAEITFWSCMITPTLPTCSRPLVRSSPPSPTSAPSLSRPGATSTPWASVSVRTSSSPASRSPGSSAVNSPIGTRLKRTSMRPYTPPVTAASRSSTAAPTASTPTAPACAAGPNWSVPASVVRWSHLQFQEPDHVNFIKLLSGSKSDTHCDSNRLSASDSNENRLLAFYPGTSLAPAPFLVR